jgi:hypothetical protein
LPRDVNAFLICGDGRLSLLYQHLFEVRGNLVSPRFINTHVHTTGNDGDYMLHDMVKNDYRSANYLSFAASVKGKMTLQSAEDVAVLRALVLLHALRGGDDAHRRWRPAGGLGGLRACSGT